MNGNIIKVTQILKGDYAVMYESARKNAFWGSIKISCLIPIPQFKILCEDYASNECKIDLSKVECIHEVQNLFEAITGVKLTYRLD